MDKNTSLDIIKPDRGKDKTGYSPLSIGLMEADCCKRQVSSNSDSLERSTANKELVGFNTEDRTLTDTMNNEGFSDQPDHANNLETGAEQPFADDVDFEYGKSVPVFKSNQFELRKTTARSLMDGALMMANISQLRTVMELGPDKTHHYYVVLSMTVFSLVCQIIVAVLMFVLMMRESRAAQKKDYLEHLQMMESEGLLKVSSDKMKKAAIREKEEYLHGLYTSRLNYFTIIGVFIITVVNMFITGFGIRNKD